jgi:hypothetical protein
MEADSTWYVYKYLGPANCSTAFYLRPHFNQKENRSRRFRRAEFRQVGNGDDIENRTKRPNGSTHWARKSALMNSSNCGVVLNLNISIANGLPSSSSSKGFLYLPPEYTGIQQLDFYWPLASNVCKSLSHLLFHFLRTKERTKWKRNEIGTADRGI